MYDAADLSFIISRYKFVFVVYTTTAAVFLDKQHIIFLKLCKNILHIDEQQESFSNTNRNNM